MMMSSDEFEQEVAERKKEALESKRAEAQLVERFRGEAFRAKMRLFGIALVANVIFVCAMWMLPSIAVHIVFLLYIVFGALPKFIFGSVLRSKKGSTASKSPSSSSNKTNGDPEIGHRTWRISANAFRCPRCKNPVMGAGWCKQCGFEIVAEHPVLVTACVTVHHENKEGIDEGVASFELSELPFERRYLNIVYIVDGRFARDGSLDLQQRDTLRWLLSRLYRVPEHAIIADGQDECLTVAGIPPELLKSDETAVYRGTLTGIPFTVLVKRKNRGKRDSHAMFFDAMDNGKLLPRTAIGVLFVDSDTAFAWPGKTDSLARLFNGLAAEKAAGVGGCCGEIEVAKWSQNPLTMMQFFEYSSNQFVSKTAESWFGMCTCLPGAFTMVRPQAMEMILDDYLAVAKNIWETNQLDLGEDRTMTTLLLRNEWETKYIPRAIARTEVPSTLVGLVKQRRRWINSTIVNMVVLLKNVRRVSAFILLIGLALELACSFTLPTAVIMLFVQIMGEMGVYKPFVVALIVMWCVSLIVVSMTATAEQASGVYTASASVGAFLVVMMLVQIVQNIGGYMDKAWLEMFVLLGWTAIIIAASIVHGKWRAFGCIVAPVSWFLLTPLSYVIIVIFALCNFDDASWGTRGA